MYVLVVKKLLPPRLPQAIYATEVIHYDQALIKLCALFVVANFYSTHSVVASAGKLYCPVSPAQQ